MPADNQVLELENARLLFRNFSGLEGKYNRAGDKNFCVALEPDKARALERDGWNVKTLKARDEDEEPQAYLQVAVSFKNFPPRIVLIGAGGRSTLDESMVEIIDWIDIKSADVVLRPYNWSVNGSNGVKAYLKAIYVIQLEDAFAHKYRDLPEIGQGPQPLGALPAGGEIIEGEVVEQYAIGA